MDDSLTEYKSLDDVQSKSLGFNAITQDVGLGQRAPLGTVVNPQQLMSIFETQDWVFIAVDRIASKLSTVPLQVHRKKIVDGEEILEPALKHPLQAVLDRPNPLQTSQQWKYNTVTEHCVTGNSVSYYAKSTRYLIQIPIFMLLPSINAGGILEGFTITSYNPEAFQRETVGIIPAKDAIHIMRPNPSSINWGLSPLVAGASSVLFNRYSNDYLNNYYQKGALPGLVLEMTQESNKENVKMLLAEITRAYNGISNSRRNMLLPSGVKMGELKNTLADQQLIEYINRNRDTIINLWQVPKHEMSLAESGSLGSEEYKTAMRNFWQGPIMTIGSQIEVALTDNFSVELGENFVIRFNYTNVPALQEDVGMMANNANAMLSTMTLNEVRQRVWKLPAVEGGDKAPGTLPPSVGGFGGIGFDPSILMSIRDELSLLKESHVSLKSSDPEPPTQKELNASAIDVYRKENPWIDDTVNEQREEAKPDEKKIKDLWLDLLAKQVAAAAKVARDLLNEKAATIPSKRQLRRAIDAALDVAEDEWVKGYTDTLESAVNRGYDSFLAVPFNRKYQEAIDALKLEGVGQRRAMLEARGLETFSKISKTTTEEMMNVIEAGVANNQSVAEIARDLTGVANVSLSRANLIARQETMTAMSLGEAAVREDAKKVIPDLVKTWINAQDARVRGNPGGDYPDSEDDHWSLQGEIVGVDEKFSNGLEFPRDPAGEASNVIGCRCAVLTVSEADLSKLGLKR